MTTQAYTGRLSVLSCASCHNDFGVPDQFERAGRAYGKDVWCPVCGYKMCFGKGEVAKLRAQLAREEGRVAGLRTDLKHTEARRRAEKAAKTKLKKRIVNGVCPCCTRFFKNLHDHMADQHPDYVESDSEPMDDRGDG